MKRSSYSNSPYGKMRDRISEKQKLAEEKKKQRKEDYYTWLVSGK